MDSKRTWLWFLVVGMAVLVMVNMCACANLPLSEIDDEHVKTQLTGQTVQRITPEGLLTSSNPGIAGTLVNQDAQGQWTAQGLPLGLMSVNPATGCLTIASPKDVRMVGLKITPAPLPGQPFMEAELVEANLTSPLDAVTPAILSHFDLMGTMSVEERKRYVESLQTVSDATRSILMKAVEAWAAPISP